MLYAFVKNNRAPQILSGRLSPSFRPLHPFRLFLFICLSVYPPICLFHGKGDFFPCGRVVARSFTFRPTVQLVRRYCYRACLTCMYYVRRITRLAIYLLPLLRIQTPERSSRRPRTSRLRRVMDVNKKMDATVLLVPLYHNDVPVRELCSRYF